MKTRVVATTIIMTGLLLCPALSRADRHYKVQNGPDRFYYGHISLVDAAPGGPTPVVRREGSPVPEEAVVNLPLAPGDTVRTPPGSRCEIQFDTGTIVRLDSETELGIGTVLAPSLSAGDRLSNLVLARGLIYVMYKRYDRSEMFQVLTPNAAVKFRHQTVAIVQAGEHSTDVQVNSGKASVLFGADERDLQQRNVGRLGRLIVTGEKETQEASWTPGTEFELWNKDVNARFEELHEGLSALPKPIQNLPEAVFYFAQAYGNRYGEWLWDDLYGYVWRPYLNDKTYPWGWGPYIYGRWSVVDGQMFWVPGEPWGWVPYHLGIWQWDKKLGWVWLPGSLFASAQVQWDFYFGYASWHARTLFDWLNWELFDGFGSSIPSWYLDYYSSGWSLWSAGYGAGHPYRSNPGSQAANWKPVLDKINLRQLKQPDTSSNGMPKEIKKVFERVTAALKQGNPRVLESLTDGPSHIVVVRKGDLGAPAIQARRVDPGRVPRLDLPRAEQGMDAGRRGVSARQQAVRVFLGGRTLPEAAPAPPAPRIEGPRRDTGANPGADDATLSDNVCARVTLPRRACVAARRNRVRRSLGSAA